MARPGDNTRRRPPLAGGGGGCFATAAVGGGGRSHAAGGLAAATTGLRFLSRSQGSKVWSSSVSCVNESAKYYVRQLLRDGCDR